MLLSELAPGVFELRLPIPWEDSHVNCFLLPGPDRVDMIDCGMLDADSLEAIEEAVRQVGGPNGRIGNLLITHIHPDHYGAAGEVAARHGARVFLHRLEVPMVHPRYLEIDQLVEEVGRYLLVHGVPEHEAEEMKNASRYLRNFVRAGLPSLQLDGSELLEMGRRRLRVEWTPGHSPGHVCLFDPEERVLFAGDQILPEASPNIGLHPQSTPYPLDDYLAGLQRLVALDPQLVLPAHGRPFSDPRPRVTEMVEHHARRKEQIVEIIGAEERSAWEISVAVWGLRDHVHERRLALQEGLAHLQSLSWEGRVEKRGSPAAITWRRAR